MPDFISQHASEIVSGVLGLLGGGAIGSILTLKIVRNKNIKASSQGTAIDQSRATAGRDIIGRDKHG